MSTATQAGQLTIYDDFGGDRLNPGRWRFLTIPHGRQAPWECVEPNAETMVGEGTLDIHVPHFGRTHDTVQVFDNLKHLLISTEGFSTEDGRMTFIFDMAATSIGETPTDYRDGFATCMLLDENTGWSFSTCSNGKRVFGLHDSLRKTYKAHLSAHVIDAPSPNVNLVANSRHHEVVVDGVARSLEWRVDDVLAFRLTDTEIPPNVRVCLGLATLNSIHRESGEYFSQGVGLSVSYGPVGVYAEKSAVEQVAMM